MPLVDLLRRAGKWNGFGGKLEPGETIEDAAARELTEVVPYYSQPGCLNYSVTS